MQKAEILIKISASDLKWSSDRRTKKVVFHKTIHKMQPGLWGEMKQYFAKMYTFVLQQVPLSAHKFTLAVGNNFKKLPNTGQWSVISYYYRETHIPRHHLPQKGPAAWQIFHNYWRFHFAKTLHTSALLLQHWLLDWGCMSEICSSKSPAGTHLETLSITHSRM